MFRPDPLPLQQQYLLATRPRLVFDVMIGDLNWSENYKSGLRVQRNGTLHRSQLGEPGHFMTSLNTISSLHTCHLDTAISANNTLNEIMEIDAFNLFYALT